MLFEVFEILRRGARLRCPCCGCGPLFQSGFRMYPRCLACDERFEREPGQWFGTIYVNIGLTAAFSCLGALLAASFTAMTTAELLVLWVPCAAAGPLLFYRRAKGIWTSIIFLGEGLFLAWPSR